MLSELETSRYFIRTGSNGSTTPRLIIFDEQGNLASQDKLPTEYIEPLLTIFNGQPKAVQRSSGGLIQVRPSQLVLVSSEDHQVEFRVKVFFTELERNTHHQVISKKVITSSKTVLLSEIREGFSYEQSHSQNFVVDLGLGVIPIHVLSFYTDSQGLVWALFVRHDEVEKCMTGKTAESLSIYEVPQGFLRWISPISTSGEKDFQWAKSHVQKLKERGETIIPESLKIGTPITVPAGLSFTALNHQLIKSLEQKWVQLKRPYFISSSDPTGTGLLLPMDENPE